jgi:anti-sigma factor RsiW
MNHEKIKQRLWSLYDGQAASEDRASLESHLRDCAECRLMFAEWENVSEKLFSKPGLSDPSGEIFTQKVMIRVRALPQVQRIPAWKHFIPWMVPVLGSAALALWVLLYLLPATPGLSQGPSEEYFFMEGNNPAVYADWEVLPVSSSGEEFVRSFIKE